MRRIKNRCCRFKIKLLALANNDVLLAKCKSLLQLYGEILCTVTVRWLLHPFSSNVFPIGLIERLVEDYDGIVQWEAPAYDDLRTGDEGPPLP